MNNLKKILKEYQKLRFLLINSKDWKKFESNNKSMALNILYVPHNTEEKRDVCKSKYNLTCRNQSILLMINDGEKYHYLAIKGSSALFRGITLKHEEYFCYLNCFCSYRTENRL